MRSLIILSFLISFSAMACPNIQGTYKTCLSQTNQMDAAQAVITRRAQGNIALFTVTTRNAMGEATTENYRADGKLINSRHKDPDSGMVLDYNTTTTCTATHMTVVQEMKMEGTTISDMKMVFSRDGSKLKLQASGTVFGESVEDVVTCE